MHYYIDGYNLVYYLNEDVQDFKKEREKLVSYLLSALSPKIKVTVVFDGQEESRSYKGFLEILYTDKAISADDWILQKISISKKPGLIGVITFDKGLSKMASYMGAKNILLPNLLIKSKKKGDEERKPEKENRANFERLLKEFDVGKDEA